jgi:hypothetical protein
MPKTITKPKPKTAKPKIAIFVEGGIVQAVRSNISEQLDVEVVDIDNDGDQAEYRWDELQTKLKFGNY